MVQKTNPHPALGCNRSPPTMYFQKMQFLGVFRPFLQRSLPTMWQKIVHWFTSSVHENYKLRTCVHKLFWMSKQFVYTTCSELLVFMYWTGKSMNNLLSYCGLVDPRISASDKDLPVNIIFSPSWNRVKVHIFWENHKILRNLHQLFD